MNNLRDFGLLVFISIFVAYLVWVGISRLILYVLWAFGVVANISPRLLGLLLLMINSSLTISKK